MRTMLLSFKPYWYEKIISGEKIFEYRNTFPDEEIKAYMYVSAPYKRISGVIRLGKRISLKNGEVTGRFCGFEEKHKYAMPILSYQKTNEIGVEELRRDLSRFVCPQMYYYIKDDSELKHYLDEKLCYCDEVIENKFESFDDNDICAKNGGKEKVYKSIELFAGAGGLALGLEQAGFKHLGLIEFDKAAAQTLRVNRPDYNVLCEDVEKVAKRDLEKEFSLKKGQLDLLSGGAPCQSFSYAGKRLGLEDVRGTMFYHYATFLRKLQPKVFLFENVRGLLTHDKGKTYKTILDIFEQEGYITYHDVLNAWDYGVAQKRERLITIGIRKDLAPKLKYKFPVPHEYKPVLKDVLKNVPDSLCAKYSDYKKRIFEMVPPGGYWRDIDETVAKEYMKTCWYMGGGRTGILRRLSYDEPSLTVLTTPQMKQTERCHPEEARPFSVRENARIQSFPDEWRFEGTIAQQYRQVGNAVPVNLAKEIGISIIDMLNQIGNCETNI